MWGVNIEMTQNLARSCRNTRQSYVTLSGLGRSSHLQLNIFSFPHREYRDVMTVGGNYRNYIPHSVNHSTVVMLGGQMDTQQGRCWRQSANQKTQSSWSTLAEWDLNIWCSAVSTRISILSLSDFCLLIWGKMTRWNVIKSNDSNSRITVGRLEMGECFCYEKRSHLSSFIGLKWNIYKLFAAIK